MFIASLFTPSVHGHVSLEIHNGPGEAEEQKLSPFLIDAETDSNQNEKLIQVDSHGSGWWHPEGGFLTHSL